MSDNAELINSAYSSFARGDIPAVIAVLAERVEWDVTAILPQGGSWRGRDGAGEFFEQLGSKWADLALEIEGMVRGQGGFAAGVAGGVDGLIEFWRDWLSPWASFILEKRPWPSTPRSRPSG